MRSGREDATLTPVVISRRPLAFSEGASLAVDRTAHVRAASGLAWQTVDGAARLVVAQDDTSHLAVIDPFPAIPDVRAIALDHEVKGRRVFEARLGNKKDKLDLEGCTTLAIEGREHVLVVGSGSLPVRERFVLVSPERTARVLPAHAFYRFLRESTAFSGSELNLEGIVSIGGSVMLLQRGNGARRGALSPSDATCLVRTDALLDHLFRGGPIPGVESITRFALGTLDGVRLTFTDATLVGERVYFLAGAEDSPDAIDDGAVVGVALGVMSTDGEEPRWGRIREADGTPYLGKAEGLAPHRPGVDDGRFWAVVDRDDPDAPAELLELAL